jgi:hypothetical protein
MSGVRRRQNPGAGPGDWRSKTVHQFSQLLTRLLLITATMADRHRGLMSGIAGMSDRSPDSVSARGHRGWTSVIAGESGCH